MLQLQQHQSQLTELAVNVLVITFEQKWRAEQYVAEMNPPWPILLDTDRVLYKAYGMERGSTGNVLGISNWSRYIGLLIRGRRLHRPTGDIYQLGGDVLIDPQGVVRLHYLSKTPIDRPEISDILSLVDAS